MTKDDAESATSDVESVDEPDSSDPPEEESDTKGAIQYNFPIP